ncbi:MAG: hypothetical protein ACREX4_19575, partial [Gammaproteobacteria bacterium]
MRAMQYAGYGDPTQLRLADVPVPKPAPRSACKAVGPASGIRAALLVTHRLRERSRCLGTGRLRTRPRPRRFSLEQPPKESVCRFDGTTGSRRQRNSPNFSEDNPGDFLQCQTGVGNGQG